MEKKVLNDEKRKELVEEIISYATNPKVCGVSFENWYKRHADFYEYEGMTPDEVRKIWDEDVPSRIHKGMGLTIHYYSDRRAATVAEIIYDGKGQPKMVFVIHNEYKQHGAYDGYCDVLDELEPRMTDIFTRRRNGSWYMYGQKTGRGSVYCTFGKRDTYIDPSF